MSVRTIVLENHEFEGGVQHNKFYRIIDNGYQVIFEWGAIGCRKPGRKIAIESSSDWARERVIRDQLRKKFYYEVISDTEARDVRMTRVSAPIVSTIQDVKPVRNKRVDETFELNGERLRRLD